MKAEVPLTVNDIITKYQAMLSEFGLRPNQIRVGAGSAMVMYGLRMETDDIDADCSPETMRVISEKMGVTPIVVGTEQGYLTNNMELLTMPLFDTDMHGMLTYDESNGTMVRGVFCYTLEDLLQQKLQLNRPKDQQDIENIRKAIAATSN